MSEGNGMHALPADSVESLLRCYYLTEFLSECFVEEKYKPPVPLVSTIALTSKGKTLAGHAKGDGVSPWEAQLAAFLTGWAGDELLIDLEKTQLDALRDQVSSEIKRSKIRFPWIYGRKLYDAVADSTFHGDPHPSHEESLQLLEKVPQGVFQLGPYVCGPYGLVESEHWRRIPPSLIIPGYHCEEIDCHDVHGVHIMPGENGVSKARSSIRRRIAKIHSQDMKYIDAVVKFQSQRIPVYTWLDSRTLPFFLFDCFDNSEINLLLVELLNLPKSVLREKCADLGLTVQKADAFASSLSESQLLQLMLLDSNDSIHRVLNELIWSGKIAVPEGETRAAQIISAGSGPLGVRIEASRLGLRYAPALSLAQVRLRGIIDRCYPASNHERQERLKWLLRETIGYTSGGKLAHVLSNENPLSIAKRLLASDELSYRTTLEVLAIPDDAYHQSSDEVIAQLINWHIGFTLAEESTELSHLLRDLSALKRIILGLPEGRLGASALSQIRQLSSDLFVALEQVLKHAVAFIAFTLLNDHFENGYKLEYSRDRAAEFFSEWLATQKMKIPGVDVDKFALGDLMECFGSLGKHLEKVNRTSASYARPEESLPRSFRLTENNPFVFPFMHLHPFLDLDESSRSHIRQLVTAVASSFHGGKVLDVRNGLQHHTKNVPDSLVISDALNVIEARITELANNGLYPLVYRMTSSESDSYGRRRVRLTSADGPEITLVRPNRLDRTGFPSLDCAQTVVVGSRLGDTGEPLRFEWTVDSTYRDRWRNFPRRPPIRNAAAQQHSDSRE